jgi:hypothetical protein
MAKTTIVLVIPWRSRKILYAPSHVALFLKRMISTTSIQTVTEALYCQYDIQAHMGMVFTKSRQALIPTILGGRMSDQNIKPLFQKHYINLVSKYGLYQDISIPSFLL